MTAQPPTRLKLIRMAHGWSQSQLAKLAGVLPGQVSNVERGLSSPAVQAKLAAVLGVAVEVLLERSWDLEGVRNEVVTDKQQEAKP